VIRGLIADGAVDVVIGTHRLLSKDVHFKRLGLLVVDEEQRFGVTHKERIKQLKTSVDVLTLSATPIPRTLQMAVGPARHVAHHDAARRSPRHPHHRHAHDDVVLQGGRWSASSSRGGQIFYVYNRVEGLYERAARLAELVPRARVAWPTGS
jgi:transcription-repair coupling factor (superfamily II helicase)